MKKSNSNKTEHTFAVCAFRESPYLEDCIHSVLNQTVKSNVCIVTSTPNQYIASLAEKYGLSVIVNSGEKGIAADWNYAVSCAETHLVTIAHQDDIYCKEFTERVLNAISRCKRPLIAFTDYYELREDSIVRSNKLLRVKRLLLMLLRIPVLWKSCFIRRRILSMGSAICCPSVTLVKKNLDMPVFENNMKSNIDWQAWEKISKQKGEFVYISKPVMMHRIHQSSTTSELIKENGRKAEDLFMYQKFWPKWMAVLLELLYQRSEKSNSLD